MDFSEDNAPGQLAIIIVETVQEIDSDPNKSALLMCIMPFPYLPQKLAVRPFRWRTSGWNHPPR